VENTSQERKDALEKQHSCEEANLLVSDRFVPSCARSALVFDRTGTNEPLLGSLILTQQISILRGERNSKGMDNKVGVFADADSSGRVRLLH